MRARRRAPQSSPPRAVRVIPRIAVVDARAQPSPPRGRVERRATRVRARSKIPRNHAHLHPIRALAPRSLDRVNVAARMWRMRHVRRGASVGLHRPVERARTHNPKSPRKTRVIESETRNGQSMDHPLLDESVRFPNGFHVFTVQTHSRASADDTAPPSGQARGRRRFRPSQAGAQRFLRRGR